MVYDRRIKYLEYLENGERVRGAGFVKAERRGTLCRMRICVKGIRGAEGFTRPVVIRADKQEGILGQIRMEGGSGDTGELCLDSRSLGQSGIAYEALTEIRILLAPGKEICCRWQEASRPSGERARESNALRPAEELPPVSRTIERSAELTEGPLPVSRISKRSMEPMEELPPVSRTSKRPAEPTEELPPVSRTSERPMEPKEPAEELPPVSRTGERPAEPVEELPPVSRIGERPAEPAEKKPQESVELTAAVAEPSRQRLPLDDKWKQLSAIYPHIMPFEDEREYLSLGPGDFVLFPSRYYRAVNNSFLLHGYHNYQHLILARVESRGEIRYYVGVPGNFYEKEKQVALMFGFESFECRQEPARSGDFGYYMMRVEL